ncbi:hypothetical protein Mgra_00001387 [Meloidogyne graminicola]|uniref:Uncharacterized protein n=1 Tax=Meloidogyne graminicola TaxID=189291 RepID=A0A8S9ZZE9_9BILA|nr:hypothetical protein Mgra_00001387 [Meloidogyne graminicola]
MFILNYLIILILLSLIEKSTENNNKFITCSIGKTSKIIEFIKDCHGLLVCYKSQLGNNLNRNYKFNKRFVLTKKSNGKGFCQLCIEDGLCSEGIEWRGFRIFYKRKNNQMSVFLQADIFKNGEVQQLKGINPNQFFSFLQGHNEKTNNKVIKSNHYDNAFYIQIKEHKSQAPPLLDDYAGPLALKLDITVNSENSPKPIVAKIRDKNCKMNNTRT